MRSNLSGTRLAAFLALATVLPSPGASAAPKHKVGFADSIYVFSVTIGGQTPCQSVVLASLPIDVDERSRVYTQGVSRFFQNGGDLNVVFLHVQLRDATGVVAVGNRAVIAAPDHGDENGAVSGVLYGGDDSFAVSQGIGEPFVTDKGPYTLELVMTPAGSPCPLQSFMENTSLSYQLTSR